MPRCKDSVHVWEVAVQRGAADAGRLSKAAVFASLIGISIGAAVRWAEYAGGRWTTYAAVRSARS